MWDRLGSSRSPGYLGHIFSHSHCARAQSIVPCHPSSPARLPAFSCLPRLPPACRPSSTDGCDRSSLPPPHVGRPRHHGQSENPPPSSPSRTVVGRRQGSRWYQTMKCASMVSPGRRSPSLIRPRRACVSRADCPRTSGPPLPRNLASVDATSDWTPGRLDALVSHARACCSPSLFCPLLRLRAGCLFVCPLRRHADGREQTSQL